ncbi:MmcQ/YjbR family DNA-binding protein [Phytomonospora endophytica]|uniref:MmcQ/YjbR family DNA-binding protein n=1 Tax=Phytomonospora endophytica TaxID=714109 RepID=A0A841FLW7_9ACTN|nr:MmcQ/YjbR family DNA-binding protein [Phytomonospora endophytica]MBB6036985.1 hypothetical protein [Phytomonospora endophytica]
MTTESEWRAAAESLPEVTERPAWGMTCYRVRDKIFTSMDPDEPETVGVAVDKGERAALLAGEPEKYFVKEGHDDNYHWMRVRLTEVGAEELREVLEDAWRLKAPKRVVRTWEEGREGAVGG